MTEFPKRPRGARPAKRTGTRAIDRVRGRHRGHPSSGEPAEPACPAVSLGELVGLVANPAAEPAGPGDPAGGPVRRTRTAVGDEAWLVTGFREIRELFADPRLGRTHPDPSNAPRVMESGILDQMLHGYETEADDHQRMRATLSPYFGPAAMRTFRPRLAALVEEALDLMAETGSPADAHQMVSHPLPIRAIAELMGVPRGDCQTVANICEAMFAPGPRESELAALAEVTGYFGPLVDARRTEPTNDLISGLSLGDSSSTDALAHRLGLMYIAGYANTVRVLDWGILLLLAFPGQRAAFHADPARAREEILRASRPPGGSLPRYAHADIDVGGVTIKSGELVLLDLGAGNFDQEVFTDPERFDAARQPNPHLSLAAGRWFCIGAPLARMEMDLVLGSLFRRFPDLRLDIPLAEITRSIDPHSAGLATLPVSW
jgi:cytochrome P450